MQVRIFFCSVFFREDRENDSLQMTPSNVTEGEQDELNWEQEGRSVFSFVPLDHAERASATKILIKSLILAQDERWRRG